MTTPDKKGTAKATSATGDNAADIATAGDSAPASAATADTSPTPAAEGSTVTLATPPFTAEFRVGQHVITRSGTPIPASEVESVRVAALRSGIALREIQ
jgi:hypothetical protein